MHEAIVTDATTANRTTQANTNSDTSHEDRAWASINTPFSKTRLLEFCQDIERIMRINPQIEYKQWKILGNNHYQVSGRNLSQVPAFEFTYQIQVAQNADGIVLHYSEGLKTSTTFKIESAEHGSKLTIIDDYSGRFLQNQHQPPQQRLNEVDKSLINWANDIQVYLVMWQRWAWLPFWRGYMRKIWQPLTPSARRITYMLLWITAFEIALISLGFIIYWLEFR